ncbi:MAG: cyclic-di-AMP receptor [Clostridia bacterium]|nr:cyclic-di-AMP receptor [Clostridia bacterium]
MKLIIAIVQDEDSSRLLTGLMNKGFGVTKLATTGGFLKAGNTTLLIGVEDERVKEAIEAIESVCKSRKQMTTTHTSASGVSAGGYVPFPVEVTVGGATLFVLNVEQFLKV